MGDRSSEKEMGQDEQLENDLGEWPLLSRSHFQPWYLEPVAALIHGYSPYFAFLALGDHYEAGRL